jgi:hypothetical protein
LAGYFRVRELFKEILMPSSKGRSLADRKRRWSLLISSRKRILAELPHLAGDLEDLEVVDKEVAALLARQAQYISKTREITKKLRSLAKKGDNLRGRVGAGIRWKYGFTADALVGFGFTPHRSKRRVEDEPGEVADLPGEEEPAAPEAEPPKPPASSGEPSVRRKTAPSRRRK